MNKLSKTEIKHKIIDIVKSKLWVLHKDCLLDICKGLNIECKLSSSKDELIQKIKTAGVKKKSIFLDIYNQYDNYWGYSPAEVEDLLNIKKSKRQELTKHHKLNISYYYESKAYGTYISTPMYDIKFILSKIGTDYVERALNDISKVKANEKRKNDLEKKKIENSKSKIDKEIDKIKANNTRKINKLLKEVKGVHFIEDTTKLNEYINSDTDSSIRVCDNLKLDDYIKNLNLNKLKATLWTKDKKLFELKGLDISLLNKNTNRMIKLDSDLFIVLNKDDNKLDTYIKINTIEVKCTGISEQELKDLPTYKKVILDTETTGLYPGYNQIAQLSYVILDKHNNVIDSKNYYFQVDNMEHDAEEVHGLSVPLLRELSLGKTFKDNIDEIYHDINGADLVICHNSSFDIGFIRTEFIRAGKEFDFERSFCTMEHYTDILKIENYYGYKWPKLEEVIDYLNISDETIKRTASRLFYGEESDIGYHDSRYDVAATLEIYIITEENIKC